MTECKVLVGDMECEILLANAEGLEECIAVGFAAEEVAEHVFFFHCRTFLQYVLPVAESGFMRGG